MTAAVVDLPVTRPLPVPVVLGWREGVRIVRHPVAVLGLGALLLLFAAVADNGPRDAFDVVTAGPTWFYGVACYFAANLVTSRDGRAHSGEWLAGLPATPVQRVSALCLAALVPTAVCAVVVAAAFAVLAGTDQYVVTPSFWHLAQAPVTVLGGCLLGTMVARWTSVPGAALMVMVAMVLFDAWCAKRPDTYSPLGTYVTWATWDDGPGWAGLSPGSPAWHVGYLLSLCAMAVAGCYLRGTGKVRPALLAGGAATVAAIATGLAQLP